MKRLELILSAALLLIFNQLAAQSIYLVSVGVADYPGKANDLNLPARDAKEVYRLYRKNDKAHAVLLTNTNATKSNVITKTRNTFNKAKPDDIVVFFFSGHGYKGGFVAYDDFISYEELRALFSACKAKNKMIFADACFSGGMREGDGATGRQDSKSNVMLFLSSREVETSIESGGMKNGFFTASLAGALKGGADVNHDRTITAKELFKAVNLKVRELSGNKQHPVMWGNFDDNMPVMIW